MKIAAPFGHLTNRTSLECGDADGVCAHQKMSSDYCFQFQPSFFRSSITSEDGKEEEDYHGLFFFYGRSMPVPRPSCSERRNSQSPPPLLSLSIKVHTFCPGKYDWLPLDFALSLRCKTIPETDNRRSRRTRHGAALRFIATHFHSHIL